MRDKVRVNPGNYVDSRKFAVREYSDAEYENEVERAAERFTPLVLKCKELGRAMRIGTYHGSLSDRIMNRFGDTPEGMVESALEFVRVCEANNFFDIILSMKASNPKIMIAAYRLLAARMLEAGMEYPFHLGVTEAGNAEDGRIKSAVGIGSLLEDGIGDTIRVSLTEEPEEEIPVAFAIARRYPKLQPSAVADTPAKLPWDPCHYTRRAAEKVRVGEMTVGESETIAVTCGVDGSLSGVRAFPSLLRWASPAGRRQPKPELGRVELQSDADLEALTEIERRLSEFPMAKLTLVASSRDPKLLARASRVVPAIGWRIGSDPPTSEETTALALEVLANRATVIIAGQIEPGAAVDAVVSAVLATHISLAAQNVPTILTLKAPEDQAIPAYRLLAIRCAEASVRAPILIQALAPPEDAGIDRLLGPSIVLGSLLCDGIGDMVGIHGEGDIVSLAFNILQASGARISKTDYVACPSCGRTLFDLQETTERIKSRTSHLVGVKLAIMGCIVNGPGEMADADFGYVGGAPGRVNLYVGKECVEKGVPAEIADDRLIELIKSHGKWHEDEDDDVAPPIADRESVTAADRDLGAERLVGAERGVGGD